MISGRLSSTLMTYFGMLPPFFGSIAKKKKGTVEYHNIPSTMHAVSHGKGISIPESPTDFPISSNMEDAAANSLEVPSLCNVCGSKVDEFLYCDEDKLTE
ncbi:hypothetical protein Trydic_g1013 [Trypoxylus dichotomus]